MRHRLQLCYNARTISKKRKLKIDPDSMENRKAQKEWREIKSVKRKIRAYFDEGISPTVADMVRTRLRWDVLTVVNDSSLRGRSDEFHFENSKKLDRLLFTMDHDFLNDARFPLHLSPGLFVLTADVLNEKDMFHQIEGVSLFLQDAYNKIPGFFSKLKVQVTNEGQKIKFITRKSEVIELDAPWFPSKHK